MKISRDDLFALVSAALLEVAEDAGIDVATVTDETPLFGSQAALDSVGLVTLIAELEGALEERYDVSLILADERAMSRLRSPFRRVGVLVDYLQEQLEAVA